MDGEKGAVFERLTQLYLQTTPEYQTELRRRLDLPSLDEGIDLIARTRASLVATKLRECQRKRGDRPLDPVARFGTCIVVPSEDGRTAKKAVKLSAIQRGGLRCLHECIADVGRSPPASSYIPPSVKGVTLVEWRDRLEKVSVINRSGNPREQFRRIRVTLFDRGVIGIWEEFVWAVT
jgi:hypothetical protein